MRTTELLTSNPDNNTNIDYYNIKINKERISYLELINK